MKYSIALKKLTAGKCFGIDRDNIISIYVQSKCGQNITKKCEVMACLNEDAMLGLGKSLIRRAAGYYNRGNPMHLDPIRSHHIVQSYGIFLHPHSIETIIGDNGVESITKYTPSQVPNTGGAMAYNFELECPDRDQGILEDFEKNDANIACFQVFDLEGNDISNQIRYVGLWFIKGSLISFGEGLIRLAHNFEEDKEIHLVSKNEKSEAQQLMGVYLSPNSCELIIKCKSFDSIDKILEEYEKEHK